jgi:cell division protein FtsZ
MRTMIVVTGVESPQIYGRSDDEIPQPEPQAPPQGASGGTEIDYVE